MNPTTTNGTGGPVTATEAVFVPGARPAGPAGTPLPDDETEAARLEARFRALVEQLPGGVYIEELDASSASYISPWVEHLTGYSAAEWTADKDFFSGVLHPDDHDRVVAAFAHVHETLLPIQIEYRVVAKDGRVVWIQDDAAVARDARGKPLYLQGFMADVTARKQSELELHELSAERDRLLERERAQNERLRSLDRMKDEFVALVSHELRTPLTSIRGYVELIQEDAELLPSETRGFLDVVDRNAERLIHLVGDLLVMAQVEGGMLSFDWAEVELEPLVAGCIEAAEPAAEQAGVELAFDCPRSLSMTGDPMRLAQLVDNLISNAIKFTPNGGRVEVHVAASRDTVVIEVRDTGLGISPEEQGQLFDRFFRTQAATDNAIAGTGLGLSIVKAIVDAHRGSIGVESVEGRGTTFHVELPVERADVPPDGSLI
jgi:PAS domain S-box-containing protein